MMKYEEIDGQLVLVSIDVDYIPDEDEFDEPESENWDYKPQPIDESLLTERQKEIIRRLNTSDRDEHC